MSATAASVTLSARSRAMDYFRRYGIVVVFIALLVILAATLPQFRTAANLRNVLQQNSVIGIIACAMTFAIISGGFDLSVGAGAALASVVGARLMIESGIPLGIVGALVAGLALGLLNGFLIAYAGVNPFVATLGTATVVRGLIYVSTNATPFFGVPMSFTVVGLGRTGPLPNATWIFLAVVLILAFVLHQTRFGHYVYAIGGNIVAAAEMGIDVRRVKLAVYALVGAERRRGRDHPHRSDGERAAPGGPQLRVGGDHRRHRRRRLTRRGPGWDGRNDSRRLSARSRLERAEPLWGLRVLAAGRHRNHPRPRRRHR